ncbi:MAG TPA: hypothetical protein VJG90_02765 [Candidatus Nanoarchaeia archaeon]|nr:hypothetical protein [Candidatus Nanoarchaeia archaeon]
MDNTASKKEKWGSFLLRFALAFALLWNALGILAVPGVPPTDLKEYTTQSFYWFETIYPLYLGIIELILGAAILVGLFTRVFAGLTVLLYLFYTLLEITTVPWGVFTSAWIHLSLFFLALSLVFHGAPHWSLDALLYNHKHHS